MSAENDLALAYHMGYDDALAKRKPDASKAQVLAPYDLATEYAKLREQLEKSEERRERQADNLINKCHTIARLQTENAKLRKQSERLFDKTLELASENSKLRELCKLCEREAENAKLRERICKLESLAFDTLSFTLACVWHLNEIAGYERMEPSSPATTTFESLLRRAKELGVPEV